MNKTKSKYTIMLSAITIVYLGIIVILAILFVDQRFNLKMKENMVNRLKSNIELDHRMFSQYENDLKRNMLITWVVSKSRLNYCDANLIVSHVLNSVDNIYRYNTKYVYNEKYIDDLDLLLLAIMRTESSFKIKAKSNVGAIGLLQIYPSKDILKYLNDNRPIYLNKVDKKSLYSPEINIFSGIMMIDQYISIIVNRYPLKDFSKINNKWKIKKILSLYLGKYNDKYFCTVYNDFIKLKDIMDNI